MLALDYKKLDDGNKLVEGNENIQEVIVYKLPL